MTGSTGDTGPIGDTACAANPGVALGSGCSGSQQGAASNDPCARTEDGESIPGTSYGGGGREASGCACASGELGLPSVWWVALAWVLLRRWVPLLLLLPTAALGQVNTQRTVIDGGDWLFLYEPTIGTPWTGAISFSLNHGNDLSRIDGGPLDGPLLERVTTNQLDASALIADWFRLGVSLPRHADIRFRGSYLPGRWGDTTVWMTLPLTDGDRTEGVTGTWTMSYDVATGPEDLWLGDPGAVQATLAVGFPMGPFRFAANVGPRFQRAIALPGVVWGNSMQWGLGLRMEPFGPFFVAGEAAGRAPARAYAGEAPDYAGEAIGTVGLVPSRFLSVSAGAGGGFAQGLSTPSLRWLTMVDVRPRKVHDLDEDGLPDLRDACPRLPEDRDDFRDADGCPDPDNDRDGVPDTTDECPLVAENINGIEDYDGCPELATTLVVTVSTEGEVEAATLVVGERSMGVLAGEPVEVLVRELEVELGASAARHRTVTRTLALRGQERLPVELALPAIPYGWLSVLATGPDGARVDAMVFVDDEQVVGEVERPAGPAAVRVQAVGFLPVELEAVVPADEHFALPVVLQPTEVRVDGDRLDLGQRSLFAVDESRVDENDPALLELLAWLEQHPEVELLRARATPTGGGPAATTTSCRSVAPRPCWPGSSPGASRPGASPPSAAASPRPRTARTRRGRGGWASWCWCGVRIRARAGPDPVAPATVPHR